MMQRHQASAADSDQTAAPGRALRWWARALRVLLWGLAGLWGLFLLSWLLLHAWIVPRIHEWRPELQRWASAAVGVPVTLGDIRALPSPRTAGVLPALVPSFELIDVRLHDAQGRDALHLPRVQAAVSVASLWRARFEQIVIERPVLEVRRRADGGIEIAGIDFASTSGGNAPAAEWFFEQEEFVVRDGTVRWSDATRDEPAVQLSDVDLVVRNGARTHEGRLDATPEAAWGDRFSLRARLREPLLDLQGWQGRPGPPWQRWSGELFAELPRVDVSRLRSHLDLSEWGVQVRAGQGALRAWAPVQAGRVQGVTLDLSLGALDLQLGAGLPALALDDARGRVEAAWSERGWSLATENLRLRTREGVEWPAGRVRVEQVHAFERQGERTTVEAQRLELAALGALAERLPLPVAVRDGLKRLQPRGRIDQIDLRWQAGGRAPLSARAQWRVKGRVSGLALAGEPSGERSAHGGHPLPGRPGIEGASVEFESDQDGGQASLALRDGALSFPDVFEQPRIGFDRLDARARWRLRGEDIEVDLDEARFANADAEGSARGRWRTADAARSPARSRYPGVLDLQANLTRAQARAVHRYIPLAAGDDARRYLRESVRAGQASEVAWRLQGDLWDLPFHQPDSQGVFRITARLQGLDMDYLPAYLQDPGEAPWPGVRGASARFLLDRAALRVSQIEGVLAGAPQVRLSEGEVDIDDMVGRTTVRVQARAQGPAGDLLAFVQRSPLDAMTDGALSQARASGAVQADVALQLPLWSLAGSRVSGTVRLDGTDLRITPGSPLLARTRGTLSFTERGFAFSGARAQLLGGEVVMDGHLRADSEGAPELLLRGQGSVSAAGLRDGGLGAVSALFAKASGSTTYSAQLGFRGGAPELRISSGLQGLALQLPAPLDKPAEASWPLRLDTQVLSLVAGRAASERVVLQLGPPALPVLDALIERDWRGPQPLLARAALAVGLPAQARPALPSERGVAVQARVGVLDLDAWQAAWRPGTPGAAAPTLAELGAAQALPVSLSLRADALLWDGRRFERVVLGATRQDERWLANVDAEAFNGYVEYRPAGAGSAGSVVARLARLTLSPAAPREVQALLEQPSHVPAMDIAVDDLQWAGRSLGRVEIDAVNRAGPGRVGEWRLNALRLTVPEARLVASGNWAPPPGASPMPGGGGAVSRRTALQFRLDVDDSGALLERLGRPGLVRGGKGRLEGQIGWVGAPFSLDHASLGGALHLDVERGQFLKVEPGAGRLLGVLSLQALPRRLVLDFRDVFSEGFAFDFVRGDARIERGVVFTNNLQMKGVNAAVLMEGTADLAREQQSLKVVVVPELNAGTASLIASAINPAVGLGTFLAQFLLRQPLQSAATQEFRITGSWSDPQVEKVARSPAAPTPALQ